MDDKFSEYVTFILNDLLDTIAKLLEERTNHADMDEVVKLRAENNLSRSTVAKLYQEPKAPKR
ncbi:hypothetical protein Scep_028405 [Stephania cephalantha]|uniref:Uncharacterized protein n=1 Tax=Stephania cephalantha TaxID=152367 RepID=A0AAP0HI42_9MAGN